MQDAKELKKADNIIKQLGTTEILWKHVLRARREMLSTAVYNAFDGTVAFGPFKGMKITSSSNWSKSDVGAKILGLYEAEVVNLLKSLSCQYLVDVGAADGYFAVGALTSGAFEKVYAFEVEENSRRSLRKNAEINAQGANLVINGKATENSLLILDEHIAKNCCMLVDIEGGEFSLMSANIFKYFSKATIIVELHNWFFKNDGLDLLEGLLKRGANTHSLDIIKTGARDMSKFQALNNLSDDDRWLLCSESRNRAMRWAVFNPRF